MSDFFVNYPQISYNISGTKPAKVKTVINLMERAKIKNIVLDDVISYFPYSIKENYRPDHVSNEVYGDVKYTWLIFLINDITDPIYEWPLGSREFEAYIKDKYGTLIIAKNTIHHYEQIIRTRVEATGTTDAIPEARIEIDEITYVSLGLDSVVRKIKYCYDWEVDRNEAKRDIKLIDRLYVSDILSEHAEKLE
jgi:hypothetical protein